jgi:hypothetical protein
VVGGGGIFEGAALGTVDFGGGKDFSSSVAIPELDLELPFLGVADNFFNLREFTVTHNHMISFFFSLLKVKFSKYIIHLIEEVIVVLLLFRRWLLSIQVDSSR